MAAYKRSDDFWIQSSGLCVSMLERERACAVEGSAARIKSYDVAVRTVILASNVVVAHR